MIEVTVNNKVHRFVFDPDTDSREDGATLVGVRREGSADIHELAPSEHAEQGAWDEANKRFGL